MATNELMSDERLARLAARIENIRHVQQVGPRNLSDLEHWQLQAIALAYADDVDELLEVIREQQAQIDAMRPIVEAVAEDATDTAAAGEAEQPVLRAVVSYACDRDDHERCNALASGCMCSCHAPQPPESEGE